MLTRLLAVAQGGANFTGFDEMAQLGWTNVKTYGAVGDGSTNDTAAIDLAIAALPADGGVLFFPPGDYLTSGDHELTTPCVVQGSGGGGGLTLDYQPSDLDIPFVTRIKCNSATNSLFERSNRVDFADLCMENVAGGTPSAGAAVTGVTSGGNVSGTYQNVTIHGFFHGIHEAFGRELVIDRCRILDSVEYNLYFAGTDTPDVGWLHLTNSYFYQTTRNADAHVKIVSGGGIKIKGNWFAGGGTLNQVVDFGVWLDVGSSINTSDLLIEGNDFENCGGNCIKGTTPATAGSWRFIRIIGNHLANYQTGSVFAIDFTANGQYDFENINITGNVMYGFRPSGGNAPHAIGLTNIRGAVIVGNQYIAYATGLLSQTTCTNINETANYSAT